MTGNACDWVAADDHARTEHPLAAEEWLASHILQKFAEAGDVLALCELALINTNFWAASKSDTVWQTLLPPASHLDILLNECDDADRSQYFRSLSKKALYQHLSHKPLALAGGLKKFWLDFRTGGECFMISARALTICWASSPEYWEWLPCRGAWFPEVAILYSVCWFDIMGSFRELLMPGSYTVSFRMQIRSASTWRHTPVKVSLQNMTHAHEPITSSALYFDQNFRKSDPPLSSPPPPEDGQPTADDAYYDDSDHHEWIECDVGMFTVEGTEGGPVEVEFSMREVEFLHWKSGIVLDGVLVRSSRVVNARRRPTTFEHVADGTDGASSETGMVGNISNLVADDAALKWFWLDSTTGGECFMISARALTICWGSSPEYWEWLPSRGAWFPEVAFLNSVCWFDIKGTFRQLLRPGSYTVSFRMQIRSASSWRSIPVKLSLQNVTYAQEAITSSVFFYGQFPKSDPPISSPSPPPREGQPTADDADHSNCDHHEWIECDVGEFIVEENESGPVEVKFSMAEVEVLHWKSGILLDGVLVRSSSVLNARGRPTTSVGCNYC